MTMIATRFSIALGLVLGSLAFGGHARAADDPMACVAEVQSACVGMEDHIEDCLATRQSSFSAGCLQQLRGIVAMAAQKTGPGACIDDVKRECAGASGPALQSCILARRAAFSAECQRVLAPAVQHTH